MSTGIVQVYRLIEGGSGRGMGLGMGQRMEQLDSRRKSQSLEVEHCEAKMSRNECKP